MKDVHFAFNELMTIVLSFADIARYRSELANYPDALVALDAIEDCEGDLEDAAIGLAIQAGQEPDTSERWLEGVAKRCRAFLCQADHRTALEAGNLNQIMESLTQSRLCPPILATPVIIFILETGVETFCEPLNYKLSSE